jgi:hypothetical protein
MEWANLKGIEYPDDKAFAFTIVDDADSGTVANLEPVYDLLCELGFRTTKTVWVRKGVDPDRFGSDSQTLEDPAYRKFVLSLQRREFEIGMHMASPGTSRRSETLSAYREFKEILGHYPKVNINHFANAENIYWGADRFDSPLLRALYNQVTAWGHFCGHVEGSEFFWGDVCKKHTKYVRNFAFRDVNTLKLNPGMPYYDPKRPYVNYWFSSSDGADVDKFKSLVSERNQEKLMRERGCCIVYTHFGKGFVHNGVLDRNWTRLMTDLSRRDGWFVPASELLDFLLERKSAEGIQWIEKRTLSYRWMLGRLWESVVHALSAR